MLLLNFEHQPAPTPFRASHAIYVNERSVEAARYVDDVPPAMRARVLSLRAFDRDGMMIAATVVEGATAESAIGALFENPNAAYLHAHYAAMGCYAASIDRLEHL